MFLIAVSIVTLIRVIFQQDSRELSVGENGFHGSPSKYKVTRQYFSKKVRQNFAPLHLNICHRTVSNPRNESPCPSSNIVAQSLKRLS
jgi:hypothetical protein